MGHQPPVDFSLLGLILIVAALTAMLCRKIGMPYSVGLVIAGFILALTPIGPNLQLTPALIMQVFLPPLIFEAAIQIQWRPFKREFPLLLMLVTVGVALAAALVAAAMHYVIGWSWLAAAFFGVLIAATDPVSVIAMFKEVRVPHRLHLLVEAESLLNDGVAALGFAVLLGIAAGASAGPADVGIALVRIAIGGTLCGIAIGWACLFIAGKTEDPLVEISLTMIAAYASFLLAERFHMSGVLATLAAGIVIGNFGKLGSLSSRGGPMLLNFWEFAAFLANSFVFILIGSAEATPALWAAVPVAVVATMAALAGRAVTVYPCSLAFARSSLAVPWKYKHVLFWGGLRGALALALALALPASLAERGEVAAAAFLVVAFSIFVQGLTMPPLVRKLGLVEEHGEEDCPEGDCL
ncbi:cation:proton antiporter [Sphingomonas alba]|uniref:Cation:proton antiporter n=1 Tax=Sphingomonas alba TaxID=2908208 RepID=A0ABT0RMC0_9SPHN|nr:cation:proton antiporter [Sphingomonas alba]MCL6683794.1 cation:proton antiporter [Sphingomonas alba]